MQPKLLFIINRPYTATKVQEAIISENEIVYSEIEVKEYDKVDIIFTCPFDEDALLRIETYNSEDVLEIKSGNESVTIMGGTNTEHMLVPGHYQFEIITKHQNYFSYYCVKSKDFSDESLFNLRQYLENLLNGLSYDLIKQRLGMATPSSDLNPTLLQLFQFLDKHKRILQKNLELIKSDPIMDLVGEYRVTPFSKKPDQKSLRWQAHKAGQKNSLTFSPRLYYEKHSILRYKNIENQWVKYIINYFLQALRKLEVSFQKESHKITIKIEQQKANLGHTRDQLQGNHTFGYEKTLEVLRRNEKRIIGRIEDLNKEKDSYLEHKRFLRQLTYLFTEYENIHWIQDLKLQKPSKVPRRLLKDNRYRKLYSLYVELFKMETKNIESTVSGVQFRRTWQLFEYYNVGIIIDILRDNDYRWVDGWLASKDSPHQHIGTLPSDTILRFEKDNGDHFIEVAYDTELESTINDKSYSRYFNHSGRRPDIRITIFKNDGSLYSEKAGLIVESKCRRHKYIYNERIIPDIKWQLLDFLNLEYFDSQASISGPVKRPIKQVVVLYPKQEGIEPLKTDHIYGDSLIYLQLEPCDPSFDGTKPFGYERLKEVIDQFLSQVEESEGLHVK